MLFSGAPSLVSDVIFHDPLGSSDHCSVLVELILPCHGSTKYKSTPCLNAPHIVWNSTSIAQAQDHIK